MKKRILIGCLIAVAVVFVVKARQGQQFVKITYKETAHKDGKIADKGSRVRVVDPPTGQYKETYFSPDGQEISSLLCTIKGVFVVRKDHIQLKDAFVRYPASSEEALKKNAVGKDTILNYTAYLNKTPIGSEIWESAELPDVPLKVIMRGGGDSFTQLEAVEVKWEEAKSELFNLPDLPLDTSPIERRFKEAQEKGDQKGIRRYADLLARYKK